MASTFSIESTVQRVMDSRDMSADFLGLIAAMYGISGSSQSRISQALRGARPFTYEHEPLRELVQNIDEFCRSVEPVPVALKKPAVIKPILDEFITNKKQEDALIHRCHVIERTTDQWLFQSVVDHELQWTTDPQNACAILDQGVAEACAGLCSTSDARARVVPVRRKILLGQLKRSLRDCGFEQSSSK